MSGYFDATAAHYQAALGRLLPRGRVWAWEGTRLGDLLLGLAAELARAHNRLLELLDEADPRSADELLDAWAEALALPGECGGELPTDPDELRALVHGAFIASGGNSPAYFIAVADAIGLTITITEDTEPLRVGFLVGDRVYGLGWAFVWKVIAPTAASGTRTAALLECLFRRQKPLHTRVLFEYTA